MPYLNQFKKKLIHELVRLTILTAQVLFIIISNILSVNCGYKQKPYILQRMTNLYPFRHYQHYLYYSKQMKPDFQRNALPNLICNFYLKRASLVFQKFILYQDDLSTQFATVRHYDYECEGIQTLISFFKKKHQNILLKAYQSIKTRPIVMAQLQSITDRKENKDATKRTNFNTNYTISEASPIKSIGLCTIRSDKDEENNPIKSTVKQSSAKLHNLLSRIKAVNTTTQFTTERIKTDHGPSRQNATFYLLDSRARNISYAETHQDNTNYYKYYQSQKMSTRNSRRQFILEKFNQIESSLCQLQHEQKQKDGYAIMDEIKNLRQKLNSRRRPA